MKWRFKPSRSWLLVLLSLLMVSVVAGHRVWRLAHQLRLQAQEYEPPPRGMVFVPAGEFLMGTDDVGAEPDQKPSRRVFLPAFYIDRFEVTNRRYHEWKKDHRFPPGEEEFPVTFVHKAEAEAFCRWAGGRLPSNAEWEKAARGMDGRLYPWGDRFEAERANVNRRLAPATPDAPACRPALANAPSGGKLAVGSFSTGASPYGCEDMAGNVWEWVADAWMDRNVFGWRQAGEARGILRGGASTYSPAQARTCYQAFEALDATCHDVGFRCAMDASPKKN